MDLVKEVQLPEGDREEMVRELLSGGMEEIVIDGGIEEGLEDRGVEEGKVEMTGRGEVMGSGRKQGRDLLGYATRRVGDYYGSRVERKGED